MIWPKGQLAAPAPRWEMESIYSHQATRVCVRGCVCTTPTCACDSLYWSVQFLKWSSNDVPVLVEALPLEGQNSCNAAVVKVTPILFIEQLVTVEELPPKRAGVWNIKPSVYSLQLKSVYLLHRGNEGAIRQQSCWRSGAVCWLAKQGSTNFNASKGSFSELVLGRDAASQTQMQWILHNVDPLNTWVRAGTSNWESPVAVSFQTLFKAKVTTLLRLPPAASQFDNGPRSQQPLCFHGSIIASPSSPNRCRCRWRGPFWRMRCIWFLCVCVYNRKHEPKIPQGK